MLIRQQRLLPIDEWRQRVRDQGCRTISGRYLPLEGGEACEYTCTAGDFFAGNTYLVRYTTADGTSLVPYNHPDATPILIRDFVRNAAFVQEILQRWDRLKRGPVISADLLVQRCSSCDRHVVIDDVHRVVWIGVQGGLAAVLRVRELAGSRWPEDMPDMKVVCTCLRTGKR